MFQELKETRFMERKEGMMTWLIKSISKERNHKKEPDSNSVAEKCIYNFYRVIEGVSSSS